MNVHRFPFILELDRVPEMKMLKRAPFLMRASAVKIGCHFRQFWQSWLFSSSCLPASVVKIGFPDHPTTLLSSITSIHSGHSGQSGQFGKWVIW
jgi:hypothetical protein